MDAARETATLAGGCFWCLEAVYDELKGVHSVESGYMGGKTANPTYSDICTGRTGHAEVVQIQFDPAEVGFRDLLAVFFTIHDPTTLNRQGNDTGTQYRSAIFYHSPEQKRDAEEVVANITKEKLWDRPVVTEIVPAAPFTKAEEEHQEYYARVGNANPYCSFVVEPKVAKFRKAFVDRLKRRAL
jgi:peptide-methionine (S)-S-oxide reductase